jgi:monofunctional biosynthetic peptidoglycan transglycosylase
MNELGFYWDKFLPKFKKKKFRFVLFYLLFLLYFSLPGLQIPLLEFQSTRITSLMEQRAIENFLLFYPHQSFVDIEDVNPNLLKGIISMEDGNFFNHNGVDWKELKTSLRLNTRRKRSVRGGSTITMQLSKNLYFTTDKSVIRKAKELLVTFRMEKEISKRAILEQYVNIIEWGDGIFGIHSSAYEYFQKEPGELNTNQSSRLAAVIPSPLKHAPNVNSNYVLRRSAIIRGRLNDVILDI